MGEDLTNEFMPITFDPGGFVTTVARGDYGTGTQDYIPPTTGPTLPGSPTQPGYGAYGGVPTVPSPGTTSVDALLANINNLGLIGQLGSTLTEQGSRNAMQPLTAAIPGLMDEFGQFSKNIASGARGEIPQDVLTLLQQQGAERGVATGQGVGSPNTNAAYLRALGLTSIGLQDQALKNLGTLTGMIPRGPTFDPSTMLLSPGMQQMWEYLASVLRAAPNPELAANTNTAALLSGLGRGRGGTAMPDNRAASVLNYLQSLIRPDTPPRDIPAGFPDPSKLPANQPPSWEDQFWADWNQGTPVETSYGGTALPTEDYWSGGYIGSDAPAYSPDYYSGWTGLETDMGVPY